MRRVDASLRTGSPSGGAVQRLSADGSQPRRKTSAVPSCNGNQPRRRRNWHPPGAQAASQKRCSGQPCEDPGPHDVSSVASILRAARSVESVAQGACGHVAGPLDRSLLPDPLLSTECPQAGADCNRSTSGSRHTQDDGAPVGTSRKIREGRNAF